MQLVIAETGPINYLILIGHSRKPWISYLPTFHGRDGSGWHGSIPMCESGTAGIQWCDSGGQNPPSRISKTFAITRAKMMGGLSALTTARLNF